MKNLINTSRSFIAVKGFFMAVTLFFFFSAQSQTIQILRFRNDLTYSPGSSVSVHLKLTGIFDLNNRFFLELSDANGSFGSPRILAETEDFFIPAINGIIPANAAAGTAYKLRVRATTNNAVIGETAVFRIVSATALTEPTVKTITPLTTERVDCINSNPVPLFGFVNKDNPEKTQPITIQITNAGTESYVINVLNVSSGTLTLEPIAAPDAQGRFSFPANLPVGYYTLEIIKTNGTISTVKSFTFLFHTGNTSLGNITNEQVCVNSEVVFTIDLQNILNNYPGSKYTIDYGDGSPREEYTHAQIIADPVLKHVFNVPTCQSSNKDINNNNYFFRVDLFLWNKGLTTTGTTNCSVFYKNGNGTTKWINTSKPPVADFTSSAQSCISRPLTLINTSTPGAYGTKQFCENQMYTSWYIKKPNMTAFSTIADFEGIGKLDYIIPASDINQHGCWEVKLEVRNFGGGCTKVSTKIKTIGIERPADPNFNMLLNGNPTTQICAGSSIKMQDISNVKNDNCKGGIYEWSVSPFNGWQYQNNTTSSTQEPEIRFNTAGTYTITFSLTNSCGTKTIQNEITVSGDPTISPATTNQTICTPSPVNETIDFNLPPFRPNYSTGALAPTTYAWTINGSSTPNADWSFLNSTNAASAYPVIKLNRFTTYTIRVSINGNCGTQSSATYTIILREGAGITNTNLTQAICSGQTFSTFTLTSSLPGTTYSWTAVSNPAGAIPQAPAGVQTGNSILGVQLTNTTPDPATLTYTVKALNNGCESSKDFVVTVNPVPASPSVSSPVRACVGDVSPAISVTPAPGNTLTWYADATTTTPLSGPPAISTASAINTSFFVSQISNTTPPCESSRSKIDVIITALPSPTITTGNSTNCSNPDGKLIFSNLAPSAAYTFTYDLNGSSVTRSNLTSNSSGVIELSGLSAGDYINIRVSLNGCFSSPAPKVTILNPSAPTGVTATPNMTLCSGETLNLSASSTTSGATFTWSGPNGFTANNAQASVPAITTAGSGDYIVTASLNGCSASPVIVSVTVVATPPPPLVNSPVNLCKDATAPILSATAVGTNRLAWYTVETGGTSSTSPPVINSGTTGSVSYFVSQVTNTTPACEGSRSKIDVNIFEIPAITGGSSDPTNCINPDGTITINGLRSGSTYQVSYIFNGAPPVISDITTVTNTSILIDKLAAGNYTDIKVTLNGCTSNTLQFELKNPAAPKDVEVTTNAPICSGNTLTLSATSSSPNATFTWSGPAWSTNQSGATISVQTATSAMGGSYTVVASVAGCSAPGVSASVQITQTPAIPVVTTPVNFCHKSPADPLVATPDVDHVIRWYDVPAGGSVQNSITPSTQTIGVFTFYASQITNAAPGCEGPRVPVIVNVFPVPSITGSFTNPTRCINPDGSITINGLVPGNNYIISYVLNGGSPAINNLSSGNNTFIKIDNLSAGNYTQITVSLNNCISNELSFDLKNPDAPSNVSITTNAPICSGNTLNLNAISATPNTLFRWTGPAWTTAQTGASQTVTNAQSIMSGDYTVIASIFGCDAPGVVKNITIYQTPGAPMVTSPVNYCHNAPSVPLSATAEGSNSLRWYATASGGSFSSQAPLPNTANLGSYEFFVSQITTNTSPACEGERAKIDVFINPIPVITASATPPNSCFVDNGTITIKGLKPGLIYEVQYDMNGVTIQRNQLTANTNGDILIINLPFGSYDNLFVVSKGCPSNKLGPFRLSSPDIPATPVVSSNSPVCPGQDLKLFATSTTPGVTFEWEGPSNFKSALQNPVLPNVTATVNGTYFVRAIFNGCKSAQNSTEVSVFNNPQVDLGPDLFLSTGTEYRFNPAVNFGPIVSWKWSPSTDLSCTNCQNPVATVRKNITYEVIATNQNGCSGKDEINIKVFCENTQVYIPNAFTPGAGNGVKNDVFYVQGKGIMQIKTFRVFNRWGEKVFERLNSLPNEPSNGWDGRIRGVIQSPDVYAYVVEVLCDNGTPFFFKGNVTLLK